MKENKKKILILDKIHESGLNVLKKKFIIHSELKIKRKELLKIIKNYHIIVLKSTIQVDKGLIDNAYKLELVARAGTGLDNIDLKYLKNKNIKLVNTPSPSKFSVAEFTIMLVLISIKKFSKSLEMISKLDFRRNLLIGRNLSNIKIGIVGYGNIGKLVAKRFKYLGAKVSIYDPKIKNTFGFDNLIKKSDVVTFHIPLNNKTKYLINNKKMKKMKDGVILINTSRAEIFHPEFYKKIKKKFTLCTDLINPEPNYHQAKDLRFKKHPWLKNKNIIFTPHIASMTHETQSEISLSIANGIIKKVQC